MRIDALSLHGMRVGAVREGQQKHLHVPVKRRKTAAHWQFPVYAEVNVQRIVPC